MPSVRVLGVHRGGCLTAVPQRLLDRADLGPLRKQAFGTSVEERTHTRLSTTSLARLIRLVPIRSSAAVVGILRV
jgi:hypothetical protein